MRFIGSAAMALVVTLCAGHARALPFKTYDSMISWGAAVQTYKTDTLYFDPPLEIPGYYHPDGGYGPGPEFTLVDVQYEDFKLYNPEIHFGWTLGEGGIGGEMHVPGFEEPRAQYFTLTFQKPLKAAAFVLTSLNPFGEAQGIGGGMVSVGSPQSTQIWCAPGGGCFASWFDPLAASDFFFPHGSHFFGVISSEPFSVLTVTKPLTHVVTCDEDDLCEFSGNEDSGFLHIGAISYKHWEVPEPSVLALAIACLVVYPAAMSRRRSARATP